MRGRRRMALADATSGAMSPLPAYAPGGVAGGGISPPHKRRRRSRRSAPKKKRHSLQEGLSMKRIRRQLRLILAARAPSGSARGMTLIEIMVVLVILGLIAGAIGYNVFNQLKEAQNRTAKLD